MPTNTPSQPSPDRPLGNCVSCGAELPFEQFQGHIDYVCPSSSHKPERRKKGPALRRSYQPPCWCGDPKEVMAHDYDHPYQPERRKVASSYTRNEYGELVKRRDRRQPPAEAPKAECTCSFINYSGWCPVHDAAPAPPPVTAEQAADFFEKWHGDPDEPLHGELLYDAMAAFANSITADLRSENAALKQQVRSLMLFNSKLVAAPGPTDEFDEEEDIINRIKELKQERDAWHTQATLHTNAEIEAGLAASQRQREIVELLRELNCRERRIAPDEIAWIIEQRWPQGSEPRHWDWPTIEHALLGLNIQADFHFLYPFVGRYNMKLVAECLQRKLAQSGNQPQKEGEQTETDRRFNAKSASATGAAASPAVAASPQRCLTHNREVCIMCFGGDGKPPAAPQQPSAAPPRHLPAQIAATILDTVLHDEAPRSIGWWQNATAVVAKIIDDFADARNAALRARLDKAEGLLRECRDNLAIRTFKTGTEATVLATRLAEFLKTD